MNKKYVAYIRVSTEKQGRSGLGLESQRNIILNYVKEEEIVTWFEEKKSGKDLTVLPELEKAKKMVKENSEYVLIVAKADRFRNTQHALNLFDEMGSEKIWFCNVGRNADKFLLTILFAFAEKERLEISIRTKAALAVLRARGIKIGRPYSKKAEPKISDKHREMLKIAGKKGSFEMKRKAVNNENNRKACIHSYYLYTFKNLSYAKITDELNSEGYRTPSGLLWRNSSVYRNMARGYKI